MTQNYLLFSRARGAEKRTIRIWCITNGIKYVYEEYNGSDTKNLKHVPLKLTVHAAVKLLIVPLKKKRDLIFERPIGMTR